VKFSHQRIIADLENGCWLAKNLEVPGMYSMLNHSFIYEPVVKMVRRETVIEMFQLGLIDSQLQLRRSPLQPANGGF
jgi:hypothetical protein